MDIIHYNGLQPSVVGPRQTEFKQLRIQIVCIIYTIYRDRYATWVNKVFASTLCFATVLPTFFLLIKLTVDPVSSMMILCQA